MWSDQGADAKSNVSSTRVMFKTVYPGVVLCDLHSLRVFFLLTGANVEGRWVLHWEMVGRGQGKVMLPWKNMSHEKIISNDENPHQGFPRKYWEAILCPDL